MFGQLLPNKKNDTVQHSDTTVIRGSSVWDLNKASRWERGPLYKHSDDLSQDFQNKQADKIKDIIVVGIKVKQLGLTTWES
jgi:predicted heme/steroid binding protein